MRLPSRDLTTAAWKRLGRLPAFPVLAVFLLGLLPLAFLHGIGADALGVVLFALLVLYCLARPAGGLGIFNLAILPGVVGVLAHAGFGVPRWSGAVLIPLSLWIARGDDRLLAARRARRGEPRRSEPPGYAA